MLVLSRKVGERILIGDNIAVTVVRIAGGGVRLGIDAPPETPIVREELSEMLKSDEPIESPPSSHNDTDQADPLPHSDQS